MNNGQGRGWDSRRWSRRRGRPARGAYPQAQHGRLTQRLAKRLERLGRKVALGPRPAA